MVHTGAERVLRGGEGANFFFFGAETSKIWKQFSTAARGAECKGQSPARGSRGFGAPWGLGPQNSTHRFSNSGSRKQPPGALRRGPRRGVSVFNGVGQEGGPLRGF